MVVATEPLFASLDAAMNFAFSTREQGSPPSPVAQMIQSRGDSYEKGKPSRNPLLGRIPVGLDRSAQAGMIKGYVNNLPERYRDHFLAKYARSAERGLAQLRSAERVLPLVELDNERLDLVLGLVGIYYGGKIKVYVLAERVGCAQGTAYKYRSEVDGELGRLASRAESHALSELQARGLILREW